MLNTARRLMGIALLIAFEVAAIRLLHELGRLEFLSVPWDDLANWAQRNPAEDTLAAILRLVALAFAYWLAASTTIYVIVRFSRVPTAIATVEWATLPAVRRLVDRAAAVTLTAAALAGPTAPALAQDGPPPVVFDIEDGVPTPRTADDETVIAPPGVGGPGYTPIAAGRDDATVSPVATVDDPRSAPTHQVVPGDNLWCIAQSHIETVHGPDVSTADIATYWLAVIEANRDRLISGDPDLIYPGEVVELPPIQEVTP